MGPWNFSPARYKGRLSYAPFVLPFAPILCLQCVTIGRGLRLRQQSGEGSNLYCSADQDVSATLMSGDEPLSFKLQHRVASRKSENTNNASTCKFTGAAT